MRSSILRSAGISAVALTLVWAASPAKAQSGNQDQQAQGLEQIVVTAQRRAQNEQDVPISVSAFSDATLERMGVVSVGELPMVTPGLTMMQSRNGFTTYLRGIGTAASGATEEGSVPVYVDGILVSSLVASGFALPSVDHVEVLKGPQGTLFGRNSTGGLINVVTRDPSHETSGAVSIGYGNYGTATGSAYVTGGITDKIAMDLTVYYEKQEDGYGHVIGLPAPLSNIQPNSGYNNESMVRSKLLYMPLDGLRITLAADAQNRQPDLGLDRTIPKGVTESNGTKKLGTYYDTQQNLVSDPNGKQWGGSAKIEYDTILGTLSSTTAYRQFRLTQDFDQDGTPQEEVDAPEVAQTNTLQQEFLLSGKSRQFDWTGGLIYFYSSITDAQYIGSATAPTNNYSSVTNQKTDSYAGFGQLTYHLTDTTNITGGFRYTYDQRLFTALKVAAAGNPNGAGKVLINRNPDTDPTARLYDSAPTWRLAIDQKINDRVLVYLSDDRGFKSGIFTGSNTASIALLPETIDTYEFGFKSNFGRTWQINGAIFDNEWKNIQLTHQVAGSNIAFNAPGARVYGAEGEIIFDPRISFGDLQLSTDLSWLHGRYDNFPSAPKTTPLAGGGVVGGNFNAEGNQTVKTPPYTISAAIDYTWPSSIGSLGVNVNYTYTDRLFWEVDNRLTQPSYGLLNARVSLTTKDGRWVYSVWGKNLSNVEYSLYTSSTAPFGDELSPAPPRTFGVKAAYKF